MIFMNERGKIGVFDRSKSFMKLQVRCFGWKRDDYRALAIFPSKIKFWSAGYQQ
jgi:hypothetical protein